MSNTVGGPSGPTGQSNRSSGSLPSSLQLKGAVLEFLDLRHKISVKFASEGTPMKSKRGFEVTTNTSSPYRWNADGYFSVPMSANLQIEVEEKHFPEKNEKDMLVIPQADLAVISEKIASSSDEESTFKLEQFVPGIKHIKSLVLIFGPFKENPLQEQAAESLSALIHKKPILDRMGKVKSFLDMLDASKDAIGDLHPAAKAAISPFSILLGKLKEQQSNRQSAMELVTSMLDMLYFIEDENTALMKLKISKEFVRDMLYLIPEVCNFALKLAERNSVQDLLSSGTKKAIADYKDKFGEFKDSYDRCIAQETWKGVEDAANNSLLNLLKPAQATYNPKDACMEGTREDILGRIKEWAAFGGSSVFWVHGAAGSGKSSVATSAAEMLKRSLGGTFFCKRDSEDQRKAENVIPTLVFRLAKALSAFGVHVAKVMDREGGVASRAIGWQFEELLHGPLRQLKNQKDEIPNHLLVVDALDEVGPEGERVELIAAFCSLHDVAPWLKIFITSKPFDHIQSAFQEASTQIVHVDMRDMQDTSKDIKSFLERSLQKFAKAQRREPYTSWISVEQQAVLLAKASNLFVWVSTMNKYLSKARQFNSSLQAILAEKPQANQDLIKLYSTVLEATDDGSNLNNRKFIGRVLGAILLTSRHSAVPPNALANLVNADLGDINRTLADLEPVLYKDASDNENIRVHHPSFLDYLENGPCPSGFQFSEELLHADITQNCLKVLSEGLRFNICKLESSFKANKDVPDLQDRIKQNIPPVLRYASLYWVAHLQDSKLSNLNLSTILDDPNIIYWVEVLSIFDMVSQGVSIMEHLKKQDIIIQNNYSLSMVNDVLQFLQRYGQAFIRSAPHLYCSALTWIPSTTKLANIMDVHFTNRIAISNGQHQTWPMRHALWVTNTKCGVTSIAFSPDGKCVASGLDDNTLRIWDATTGHPVGKPLEGHVAVIKALAYSPNGRHIVSGSEDNTLKIWDATTGHLVGKPLEGHTEVVNAVDFSPDGKHIVSGSYDQTLRIWNATTGDPVGEPLRGHDSERLINAVAYSPDGKHIVSGSHDKTLGIWDATTGNLVGNLPGDHAYCTVFIAYSPDGRYIIAVSLDVYLSIWDANTHHFIKETSNGDHNDIIAVACSPDGKHAVSGSADNKLRIWSATTGHEVKKPLEGHTDEVTAIAYSPDGRHIVSGSSDKTLRIWDATTDHSVHEPLERHTDWNCVNAVAYSPDGKHIASGYGDGTLRIMDVATGHLVVNPQCTSQILDVAYSPDGKHIVSGSSGGTLRIWDAITGHLVGEPLEGHTRPATSVTYSPDGKYIVSGSYDETLKIWEASTGDPVGEPLRGHTSGIYDVAYSPDGKHIISGSVDGTLRIWDVITGHPIGILGDGTSIVHCIAYSPNGRHIAGCSGGRLRIWDAITGYLISDPPMEGHTSLIHAMAYSPDGKHIVSASTDNTLRIWDATTGHPVGAPLEGHTGWVKAVTYSPDGKQIVSGSEDNTLRIWDATANNSNSNITLIETILAGDSNTVTSQQKCLINIATGKIKGVGEDGWLKDQEDNLILWVPADMRNGVKDMSLMTLPPDAPDHTIALDFSRMCLGEEWVNLQSSASST